MSRRCCALNCFNTIITNKNVEYFGFPKSEEFSKKWAIAAGRDDLLGKPIHNVIKYYLCASHFTDDCFTDETRTQLRKQSRPNVVYPIPSIFKNNIAEFMPESVKVSCCIKDSPPKIVSPQKRKEPDEIEEENVTQNKRLVMKEEERQSTPLHLYIIPETSNNEDLPQLNYMPPTEEVPMNQCRLCANFYSDPEKDLIYIFDSDEVILDSIERLLPETIFLDDGKPQHICWSCLHRMNQCIDTIESFYNAQAKFD